MITNREWWRRQIDDEAQRYQSGKTPRGGPATSFEYVGEDKQLVVVWLEHEQSYIITWQAKLEKPLKLGPITLKSAEDKIIYTKSDDERPEFVQ